MSDWEEIAYFAVALLIFAGGIGLLIKETSPKRRARQSAGPPPGYVMPPGPGQQLPTGPFPGTPPGYGPPPAGQPQPGYAPPAQAPFPPPKEY